MAREERIWPRYIKDRQVTGLNAYVLEIWNVRNLLQELFYLLIYINIGKSQYKAFRVL